MPRGSKRNESQESPPGLEEMRARLEMLELRMYAAKIAYLNRTPWDGKELAYEDLNAIAKEYIEASYALQKAKWGSIRVRMSVAKLLR